MKFKQRRNVELLSTAAIEIRGGREAEAACRGFFNSHGSVQNSRSADLGPESSRSSPDDASAEGPLASGTPRNTSDAQQIHKARRRWRAAREAATFAAQQKIY